MHQRGRIRLISFELLSKIIENNIIIKHTISPWITDEQKIWKSLSNSAFLQNNKDDIGLQLLNAAINLLLTYNKDEGNSGSVLEILWMLLQTHAGYLQNHNSSLSSLSIANSERLFEQISNVISLLEKHENNDENKSNDLPIWQQHFRSLYKRIDCDSTNSNTY